MKYSPKKTVIIFILYRLYYENEDKKSRLKSSSNFRSLPNYAFYNETTCDESWDMKTTTKDRNDDDDEGILVNLIDH
jgi:hypothetical protein